MLRKNVFLECDLNQMRHKTQCANYAALASLQKDWTVEGDYKISSDLQYTEMGRWRRLMGMNCVVTVIFLAQGEPPEESSVLNWISWLTPWVLTGLVYWRVRAREKASASQLWSKVK